MALIMMEFSNDVMGSVMVTWHTRMSIGPKTENGLSLLLIVLNNQGHVCVATLKPTWLVTQLVWTQMVM